MTSTISDFVEYTRDTFQICEDTDLHMCDVREVFMEKMDKYRKSKHTTCFAEFPLLEWIQYETTRDELKSLHRAHEKICNFQTAHIGVCKITAKKWKSETHDCGICLEPHSYRDSIVTSCKHHFGKECFYKWIHTNMRKDAPVSCPYCRTTDYTITRYKRLSPTQSQKRR